MSKLLLKLVYIYLFILINTWIQRYQCGSKHDLAITGELEISSTSDTTQSSYNVAVAVKFHPCRSRVTKETIDMQQCLPNQTPLYVINCLILTYAVRNCNNSFTSAVPILAGMFGSITHNSISHMPYTWYSIIASNSIQNRFIVNTVSSSTSVAKQCERHGASAYSHNVVVIVAAVVIVSYQYFSSVLR